MSVFVIHPLLPELLGFTAVETYAGQGYADSAQTAWARHVATDVNQRLIGTIDRHNHASRATAQRTGRPRVLDDIFIAHHPSGPEIGFDELVDDRNRAG